MPGKSYESPKFGANPVLLTLGALGTALAIGIILPLTQLLNPSDGDNPEKVKGEEAGAIKKGAEAIKKGVGTIFDIFGRPILK